MQTICQSVEILESSGDTDAFSTTIADRFDLSERITHEFGEWLVVL